MPRLEYADKGFRKLSGGPVRSRLPVTPTILEKLKMVWAQSPEQRGCNDAMGSKRPVCACFFAFCGQGR